MSGSCGNSCARSLYQDPSGPLLWDNLCKISVTGSLCEDPLDHLYQDPAGALVQDLCDKIFWTTVSGSYRRTSARSLSQDLCARILLGHLHQDLVNEQILRDILETWSEAPDFQNERFVRDFLENERFVRDFPEN